MFLLHGFEWTMSQSGAPELRQPLPWPSTTTTYAKCRAQYSNAGRDEGPPWPCPTAAPVITRAKVGGIALGPAGQACMCCSCSPRPSFPRPGGGWGKLTKKRCCPPGCYLLTFLCLPWLRPCRANMAPRKMERPKWTFREDFDPTPRIPWNPE